MWVFQDNCLPMASNLVGFCSMLGAALADFLFEDKYLLICYGIVGCSTLLSVTLAPWLMARSMRRRGLPVGNLALRIALCLVLAAAVPIGLLMLFGALAHPVLLPIGLGGAILLCMLLVAGQRLPLGGWQLGVILLCNAIFLATFMVWAHRMDLVATRGKDSATLRGLAQAMVTYEARYGVFPDDLRRLVDAKFISPDMLVPVSSGAYIDYCDAHRTPMPGPYARPCEFTYIGLPASVSERLVWVWESPSYNDGEGAYAAYIDCSARWLTPDELSQELERTNQWLAAHPARATSASGPAGTGGSRR